MKTITIETHNGMVSLEDLSQLAHTCCASPWKYLPETRWRSNLEIIVKGPEVSGGARRQEDTHFLFTCSDCLDAAYSPKGQTLDERLKYIGDQLEDLESLVTRLADDYTDLDINGPTLEKLVKLEDRLQKARKILDK